MLTIKAPIELQCNTSMVSSQEAFYHKIVGNYGVISSGISKEDLLHVVTAPPEVYLAEGGMTNIVNQTSLQNRQENKVEILNNFLNRISVNEDVNLTYQDRVYISNVLRQLGVTNVQEFMKQVSILKEESQNTEELISLYWDNLSELSHTVKEYHDQENIRNQTEISSVDHREHHLHQEVMNRLQTGAIYQILNNFYKSRWNLGQYVDRQELLVSEQKRTGNQILLNQLKTVIRGEAVPFVYRHENYYEDIDLDETQITDETINSQITSAVLLNLIDNLFLTRMERNFGDHQVWLRMEDALYQTAENTLLRFKNEISENRIRQASKEEIQVTQNAYYRQEIQAAERILQAVNEGWTSTDEDTVDMIVQNVMQQIEVLSGAESPVFQDKEEDTISQAVPAEKKERKTPDTRPLFMERVEAVLSQPDTAAAKKEKGSADIPEQTLLLPVELEDAEPVMEDQESRQTEFTASSRGQGHREEMPAVQAGEAMTYEEMEVLTRELARQEIYQEARDNIKLQVEQYLSMTALMPQEIYRLQERSERIPEAVMVNDIRMTGEIPIMDTERTVVDREQVLMEHPGIEEPESGQTEGMREHIRDVRRETLHNEERSFTEGNTEITNRYSDETRQQFVQNGDLELTHIDLQSVSETHDDRVFKDQTAVTVQIAEPADQVEQQTIEQKERILDILKEHQDTLLKTDKELTVRLLADDRRSQEEPQELIHPSGKGPEEDVLSGGSTEEKLIQSQTETEKTRTVFHESEQRAESSPAVREVLHQTERDLREIIQTEKENTRITTDLREQIEHRKEVSHTVLEKWMDTEKGEFSVSSEKEKKAPEPQDIIHAPDGVSQMSDTPPSETDFMTPETPGTQAERAALQTAQAWLENQAKHESQKPEQPVFVQENRFETSTQLHPHKDSYVTEETISVLDNRRTEEIHHLRQDMKTTFTNEETNNRYLNQEQTTFQNPEENPEILMEQLKIINSQNIENLNQFRKVVEHQRETMETQTMISAEQKKKESLMALTAPQELIHQYREKAEQEKTEQEKKNLELYELLPPDTRKILEMVKEYQKDPSGPLKEQIGKNQTGMLIQDVRKIQTEQEHAELIHKEDAKTIKEMSETVLEKWNEEIIRESAAGSRSETVRKDMNLVHKQIEQQINEEMLEQLLAENRLLNQKNQVTEQIKEESHTTKTTLINQNSQIVRQENQDLTELIQRGVQKQIGVLSDQIYSRLEKKLQNEKKRRGY